MDDTRLAELEHQNLIEALTTVAGGIDGALVRRSDGVAVFATGLALLLFNQALVESTSASPATIEDAVATFRQRGDRFVINLRRRIDVGYVDVASRLGLVRLSEEPWLPAMALHPIGSMPSAPAELVVREVRAADGLADHVEALAAGFELDLGLARAIVGPTTAADPSVRIYVGYVGGRPVVSGLGYRTDRTIGVYNIATVPESRRRGFGAAMTARIIRDGEAAGCDVAILQASTMGRPIYERMGFRTVLEYDAWVNPPDA